MISISVFSIFMCQCIYLMSLLLYMLKIMKKMNVFCLFKYLPRFADFCRFFPPMLPRRCFLDPCRFFVDADVFFYAPNPSPEASHSTTKGCEKYGNAKTGQELIITFISSKVFCAKSVQVNASFFYEIYEGCCKLGESLNVPSVISAQTQETSQFCNCFWRGPISNSSDFLHINLYSYIDCVLNTTFPSCQTHT